jgi:uncharacterized membrane protein HdeD (DUF308 family)
MSASISMDRTLGALARSWRWTLAFGILCALVGLGVLFWPRETVRIVAILFAVQLIAASVFRFLVTFARTGESVIQKLQMAALASFAFVIGIILLEDLHLSIRLLTMVLGVYWGVHGVIEFVEAINLSSRTDRIWVVASGIMGVVVGVILIVAAAFPSIVEPYRSPLTLMTQTLGAWLVVFGLIMVVRAFRVRSPHAAGTTSGLRPAGT